MGARLCPSCAAIAFRGQVHCLKRVELQPAAVISNGAAQNRLLARRTCCPLGGVVCFWRLPGASVLILSKPVVRLSHSCGQRPAVSHTLQREEMEKRIQLERDNVCTLRPRFAANGGGHVNMQLPQPCTLLLLIICIVYKCGLHSQLAHSSHMPSHAESH